jgi:hypothetical protein
MNNKISVIRVRDYKGCVVCGIELLDKSRKTIGKFDIYGCGDWKEYHLQEGEVITGVFGSTVKD